MLMLAEEILNLALVSAIARNASHRGQQCE